MKKTIFFILTSLFSTSLFAVGDYWQQYVHYDYKVKLDVESHTLSGDGIITYKNNSPDTLDRIYLHLYPNAFKDENSTMAREAKKLNYRRIPTPQNNGYLNVLEFRITRKNKDVIPGEAPVVAYHVDDTILESKLPELLPPGEELQIYIKFFEKIPSLISRGGWRGNQYDLAQWYPKLVVYDEKGWHPDQFHISGEFYGEFATFDVAITLPYNYIIAATGVVSEGDPGWSWVEVDTSLSDDEWEKKHEEQMAAIKKSGFDKKERTVKFHAEKVHDFAWLASPDFLYERGEWHSIPVYVLYRKHAKDSWSKKVAQRGEKVLEWLSTKFGMYPYPQLSITHGLLGGGMEYPMLVMNSGPWEGLISHEVGHIYFYGILASDELAESWMDEGFTTYQESWYQQVNYGPWGYDSGDKPDTKSLKFKLNPQLPRRESTISYLVDYLTSGYNEPAGLYAHKFKGGYGINAYTKGALFFEMIHKMVGDSLWDQICHTYFDRWKFKHVNEGRFKQVCEDVTGEDFDWFFDQWLHRTVTVDYALGKVSKKKQPDGSWRTEVEVKRKDKGVMPVDVELTTTDGAKVIKRWSGKDKKGKVVFLTSSKPGKVVVDPNDNILDKNRLNNGGVGIKFLPYNPFAWGYRPRNDYVVKYSPKIWYNDVDGLWIGARLIGSYMNKFKSTELGITYGIKSGKLGGNFRFRFPAFKSSDKLRLAFSGISQEGRAIGEVSFQYRTSERRNNPPFHTFDLKFNTAQLLDGGEDYTLRRINNDGKSIEIPEWEKGIVNKLILNYNFYARKSRLNVDFGINGETSQEFFASEFNYSKLNSELNLRYSGRSRNFETRFFAGTFFGGEPPLQDKFFIDGANPRERFSKYYLRSIGAVPTELNYHFPGGGNLRGYVNQALSTERVFAVNTELSTVIMRRLFRKFLPRRSSVRLSAFFDGGRMMSENDQYKNLMDAGLGLHFRIYKFNNYTTFRFDFPIWVSDPVLGEKQTKFRWVFNLSSVLN